MHYIVPDYSLLPVGLLVLGALTFGCQDDVRSSGWPDRRDSGMPDTFADGNPEDMGVSDARDSGTDTAESTYVFPEEPPSGTHCNDQGWCWIHPAPIPHNIRELESVGDRVFGVAEGDALKGLQPMIWNEGRIQLLNLDFEDYTELADLIVVAGEWLALDSRGDVFAISPEGKITQLRNLPGSGYDDLSAASRSRFLAVKFSGGGAVVRDGTTRESDEFPGHEYTLKMWPNGEVWGIEDGGERDQSSETQWNLLSAPSSGGDDNLTGLGPGPEASCGNGRWFGYSKKSGTLVWPNLEAAPTSIGIDSPRISKTGCDAAGDLAAVDVGGGWIHRVDGTFQRERVSEYALSSSVIRDDRTFAGGDYGTLVEIPKGEGRILDSGFRAPPGQTSRRRPRFTDLWVNDGQSQAFLSYRSGGSIGKTDRGWSITPTFEQDDGTYPFDDSEVEVFGQDSPLFAVADGILLRWANGNWEKEDVPLLDQRYVHANAIAGSSAENIWVTSRDHILRYDGSQWRHITPESSAIREFIDENKLSLRRLYIDPSGDTYVLTPDSAYRITGEPGNWGIENAIEGSPCPGVETIYHSEDGTLWTAFEADCVARRSDGAWAKLQEPPAPHRNLLSGTRAETFVPRPGERPPLFLTGRGILEPQPDGSLREVFAGKVIDGAYLSKYDAVWALTPYGVVAKHY